MKKIAVILSECGVYDGSEIHEATFTLLSLAKNNCTYEIFAPNIEQYHVINHLTGEVMDEKRNVLVEAARIARGKINDITELNTADFDGIILPGGFGAAKNLSNYAFKGKELSIHKCVEEAVKTFHREKKPIGALCISPVIIAKLLPNTKLTIGVDASTASDVESLGAIHQACQKGKTIVDRHNKVVTTPCYMLELSIDQIAKSINKLVKKMIKLML